MNCIIIGNSGSGKSWLAKRISNDFGTKLIHLDELFWRDSQFKEKRNRAKVTSLIVQGVKQDSLSEQSWVVEGVYSLLIQHYMDDADLFIWLDIEWELCKERLVYRNSQRENEGDQEFIKLLEWGSHYKNRSDTYSFEAHMHLYNSFKKRKFRIRTENEVDQLLDSLQKD